LGNTNNVWSQRDGQNAQREARQGRVWGEAGPTNLTVKERKGGGMKVVVYIQGMTRGREGFEEITQDSGSRKTTLERN